MAHDLVVVHSILRSEPPYLTLTLAAAALIACAISRGSFTLLTAGVVVSAFVPVLRYLGVANFAAALSPCSCGGLRRACVVSVLQPRSA